MMAFFLSVQKEYNSEKINHRKDARHNVTNHNTLKISSKDKYKDIWLPPTPL